MYPSSIEKSCGRKIAEFSVDGKEPADDLNTPQMSF